MTDIIQLTQDVTFEQRGHFAVITIDRAQARNAINAAVAIGIEAGIDRLESTDELRVGILTGVPPVFCVGADLKELRNGSSAGLETPRGGFGGITTRVRNKPIIAAVDGPALAGGAEITLACDLIVASRRASFGIPEVKRCLVAAAGGLFRLGRKIPFNMAMECALTGDPISAERAHQFGLVNVLCDDGEALGAAAALADRVSANAPIAVRESRRIVQEATHAQDEVGWQMSRAALATTMRTADFTEGLAAFADKRPPSWIGR